jgi:hypothetical protein
MVAPPLIGTTSLLLKFLPLAALALLPLLDPAPARADAASAHAREIAVRVDNRSEGELCAEKDNIQIDFTSPILRSMRVQAVHPAFINTIVSDRWAPDFTSCDMSHDPSFGAKARRVTFWETPKFWLTGYTQESFWRPANTPLRVGDRVENGLHVVQLWTSHRERAEEILVLYPADGYWRMRPLPFADMRWTAYGSSFLIGPVEVQERPIVDIREIAFDPATLTFTLTFARGGSAKVKLNLVDQDRIMLDVTYDGAMPKGAPFATLRSMYATELNSDAAQVAWRTKGGLAWGEAPVMTFPGVEATEFWVGRRFPSRHNLSAPDMIFSHFETR